MERLGSDHDASVWCDGLVCTAYSSTTGGGRQRVERARNFRRHGIRGIDVVAYLLQCRASAAPLSPMSSFGGGDSLSQTSLFARFPLFPTSNSATSAGSGLSYLQTLSHDANAQAVQRTRSVRHRLRCASSICHRGAELRQHSSLGGGRVAGPPSLSRSQNPLLDNWRLTVRLGVSADPLGRIICLPRVEHCLSVSVFFQSHRLTRYLVCHSCKKTPSTFYRPFTTMRNRDYTTWRKRLVFR